MEPVLADDTLHHLVGGGVLGIGVRPAARAVEAAVVLVVRVAGVLARLGGEAAGDVRLSPAAAVAAEVSVQGDSV